MAQMNRVYSKKLEDALAQGKSFEEAHKIAMADPEAQPTPEQAAATQTAILEQNTKKRLANTFEGKAATKAGSATQVRAMKRRGGTIPGINQPAPLTEDEKRLKRAGLSDKQIRALKGK